MQRVRPSRHSVPPGKVVRRSRVESREAQRHKRGPSSSTALRVQWLDALVKRFGPEAVAEWGSAPTGEWSFESWCQQRMLWAARAS